MAKKSAPGKQFAELWDPQGSDIKQRIGKFSWINKLSITAPFAVAAATGAAKKERLAIIAALSGLGFAQSQAMHGRGKKMTIDLVENQTQPAEPYLQQMAEKLFKKAGLKDIPVVKIVYAKKPEGPAGLLGGEQMMAASNHGIGIIPRGLIKEIKEPTVIIGHKTLQYLTRAEMAAVLAHETGHALVKGEACAPASELLNKVGTSATFGITLLGFLTTQKDRNAIDPVKAAAVLPLLIGEVARTYSLSQMQKTDEERADRNSMGLFPHKTALVSALEKLRENTLKDMGAKNVSKKEGGLSKLFNMFGTHKSNGLRTADAAKYYAQAEKFYKAHGIDVQKALTDIAGSKPDDVCGLPPQTGGHNGNTPKP